jgi:hypothetical protein
MDYYSEQVLDNLNRPFIARQIDSWLEDAGYLCGDSFYTEDWSKEESTFYNDKWVGIRVYREGINIWFTSTDTDQIYFIQKNITPSQFAEILHKLEGC